MARTDPRPHYGRKRRRDNFGYIHLFKPDHALARRDGLAVITIGEHTRLHARERAPAACPQGHFYTPENTAFCREGWRYCKTCNRERVRMYKAAKRATRARAGSGEVKR